MNKSIETSKINFLDPNPDGKMPVLLLHGLGSDATSWQLQMDYLLANGLRPIAIDLPGFGESICNPELWSLKYCAQSCNQLMDSLSINHYDVIGISMGGVVAQIMALDYSERVNRLVLINTFACLRPQKWDEWYYLIKRYLIAKIRGKNIQAQLVAKRLFPEPDQELYRKEIIKQIQQANPIVYEKALRGLGLLDIRRLIRSIQNKTMVITAEMDSTVPVRNQLEMAKLIAGSRQVMVANARHAVIIDQPEVVNLALMDFLAIDKKL